MNGPIFPLCYTGSIEYFSILLLNNKLIIESSEFVPKQTTRTFLEIVNSNGLQKLSIPVNNNQKTPYNKVTIDNRQRWQHQHWHSIISAYNSSPFFEHYFHLFENIYFKKHELLFDFNLEVLTSILKCLKINPEIIFSTEFLEKENYTLDYRTKESFKKTREIKNKEYNQVFLYKNNFTNNLSILDLLFNIGGPEAKKYLLDNSIS